MTTVLFLFLLSFLFLTILEDFKLTQQFYFETKDYYIAKIMTQVFLTNKKIPTEKGELTFSKGTLFYHVKGNYISMEVKINNRNYIFKEEKNEK